MFAQCMTAEARLMGDRPFSRTRRVLLIEDNPIDVMMAEEAFKEGAVDTIVSVVRDGTEALDYLRQRGKFTDACLPDFILLDLNLPKKDGRQVLAEIKADPVLKSIPVAVLSGSSDEEDVRACYAQHANCYIVKPSRLEDYIRTISALDRFWFDLVILPGTSSACDGYATHTRDGDRSGEC